MCEFVTNFFFTGVKIDEEEDAQESGRECDRDGDPELFTVTTMNFAAGSRFGLVDSRTVHDRAKNRLRGEKSSIRDKRTRASDFLLEPTGTAFF